MWTFQGKESCATIRRILNPERILDVGIRSIRLVPVKGQDVLEHCRSDGSEFVYFHLVRQVEERGEMVVDVLNVNGDGHERTLILVTGIGTAAEDLEFQEILRRVSVH